LSKQKSTTNADAQELTTEQVWDVLKFTASLYGFGFGYQGMYSPDLSNSQLKNIGLHPIVATADKIDQALSSPKDSETELIGYAQWLELNSMLFKRIMGFYSGLLSFDWTYSCVNVEKDDYLSKAYDRDVRVLFDFFDRFDVKAEGKTILRQLMRQEAYFGVFRDESEKYTFQELNEAYCKITGKWDYGSLLYDFDMRYFLEPGIDINMFPAVFKKMLNKVLDPNGKPYNPSNQINKRTSTWALWHQTSPKDNFFCFKFTPELGARIPWLSPLMPDVILQPVIRTLQKNSYIQQASKIIYTQVPLLDNVKGASVKDQVAISPELLGKFLALVKQGLPDAIKIAASPTEETQAISFDGNNEIYQSYLQNTAASSGVNSRLLFSIDRQNTLETKYSMDIDSNVITPIYAQFQNMINYYLNKKTKKYKFKVVFEGIETGDNRAERLQNAKDLAGMGIVMPHKFAAALGMQPQDFQRQLDEARAFKWVDKLTPIIAAAQMSGKEGAGRPAKDLDDLEESGLNNRGQGSNIGRGGKI
jgi:hypothetical protein